MQMNYTSNRTTLELNLSWQPQSNSVAWAINAIVDDIPTATFQTSSAPTGRPSYPPQLLLKLWLFGYLRQTFSGRKLVQLANENLVMRWFIGPNLTIPSYRTFNRFRSNPGTLRLIEGLFRAFRDYLTMIGLFNNSALFIDGTKILADANKYTFVWRKSIEKAEPKLDDKTASLYQELLNYQVSIPRFSPRERALTSADLIKLTTNLTLAINGLTEKIKFEKPRRGGSQAKRHRRKLKHFLHLLTTDYLPRKQRYELAEKTFGDRNSFSKTDHDATFMRMKEDPMRNGQLKPGYNLQVASQRQFALYYQLFQRPTDTRTLIPFVTHIFKQSPRVVQYLVADAGYGSEMNYQKLTDDFQTKYLIPYGMYEKEQTRSYHKDRRKVANWQYDELNDQYTDPDGIIFNFHHYSTRHDRYGYERQFKVYRSVKYFEDPKREALATTKRGNRRQISVNYSWLYFKDQAKKQLTSKVGHALYAHRKIEIEPIFADLKTYLKFKRFSVRGLTAATNEIGIALMAENLSKLSKTVKQAHIMPKKSGVNCRFVAINTTYYFRF
ncbi:IS1182 family transposase [Levilactobacillus brevis]|nr:IS1182 family transposase [Levilactobacillus brevis]